jgi:3-phenylpropionate/trans-cinnamate dioxygenase ferredoxin subunit
VVYVRVGKAGDFAEGLVRTFDLEGTDVAVVCHQGRFHAFSGRCPHEAYLMNYTRVRPGDLIICSSHLAVFDLDTGKVLSGPADKDLTLYGVRVEGDDILVSLDGEDSTEGG